MDRRSFIHTLALGATASLTHASTRGNPGLRQHARKLFPLGVAVRAPVEASYSPEEQRLIRRHFSIVTPENAMKWHRSQPKPGPYQLDEADRLVVYANRNGLQVVGHTLLFNRDRKYPNWVFENGTGKASRDLVERRLRNHIVAMMTRYRGGVYAWDVVNEAVRENEPYYHDTDWYKTFGPGFVPFAFRVARETDPDALLIYNDYSVELPRKRERVLLPLEDLKREGVRPDVVGIQGHWEIDNLPLEHIEETIIALHAAGVRVAITELDIDVVSRRLYWDPKTRPQAIAQDPYRDGCPADVLKRQAEQYGRLFRLLARHAEKIERVTFWGLTDKHSWLNSWPWKRVNHGLLFDRQARPKPAFHAVEEALRSAATQA